MYFLGNHEYFVRLQLQFFSRRCVGISYCNVTLFLRILSFQNIICNNFVSNGSYFLRVWGSSPQSQILQSEKGLIRFTCLGHVMRAILSVWPKCSHRCFSLKEPLQNLRKSSSTQPKTQPSKPLWEQNGLNISRFKLFRSISYVCVSFFFVFAPHCSASNLLPQDNPPPRPPATSELLCLVEERQPAGLVVGRDLEGVAPQEIKESPLKLRATNSWPPARVVSHPALLRAQVTICHVPCRLAASAEEERGRSKRWPATKSGS